MTLHYFQHPIYCETAMNKTDSSQSLFSREYWQEDGFSPAMKRSYRNVLFLTIMSIVGTFVYLVYLLVF